MRRRALAILAACGPAGRPVHHTVQPAAIPSCTLTIASDIVTIAGHRLPDFRLATLRAVLGAPDRVEHVATKGFYEEFPLDDGTGGSSEPYTSTDHHYVYDELGLVFRTRNGFQETATDPSQLLVFFPAHRTFDNVEPPAALPKRRGTCRLVVGDAAIDPDVDLRPAGLDPVSGHVQVGDRTFGVTSYMSIVDGIYSIDDGRHLRIYLDDPARGRPAYAEIQ